MNLRIYVVTPEATAELYKLTDEPSFDGVKDAAHDIVYGDDTEEILYKMIYSINQGDLSGDDFYFLVDEDNGIILKS